MRSPIRVGALLAAAVVAVGTLASPALAASGPDLDLTLAVGQVQTDTPDIPIKLTVVNRGAAACQIAAMSDGNVRLIEVLRDGKPVRPTFGEVRYAVPLSQQAADSLQTLAPGGEATFSMAVAKRDKDLVLSTVDGLPSGGGIISDWALSPGRYRISAVYTTPQSVGRPPCGGSDVATVDFTVPDKPAAEGQASSWRWWWIAAVVLGVVLLAIVVWIILRRRRRAATAVVLVLALIASGLTAGHRPAYAEVGLAGEPGEYLGTGLELGKCLAIFRAPGGDPAMVMPVVDRPNVKIKVRPRKSGDQTDSYVHNEQGQTVYWDAFDKTHMLDKGGFLPNDPGTLTDPCAELYHELAHAKEFNETGKTDKRPCDKLGIETTEAAATLAENKYRASRKPKLLERRSYGPYLLPKKIEDCEKDRPSAPKKATNCTPANTTTSEPGNCDKDLPPDPDNGNPGMSNGDPHLKTLDGRFYDFQAVGEFVAVESTGVDLVIQTRQSAVRDSKSVSLNTAVAFKIGPDRLQLVVVEGAIAVSLNGKPERWVPGSRALPGGGKAARRPSPIWSNQDGYTIRWPDGSLAWVDILGGFGLRLYVQLAETRKGAVRGLLGDFDGNADNDLRPRGGGEPLKDLTHQALYGGFGDGWRLTPTESLFTYNAGESTQTFTDRSFPDKIVGAPELDAAQRDAARAICETVGITDPVQLDACILDVALTGQAAFAVNSLDIQTNPVLAVPGNPTGPVVRPGGTLRDGNLATGETAAGGESRRYTLDLDGARDFFVADWHGLSEGCDQAFLVNLVDVSNANQPCTNGFVSFHVDDPAKTYQVEIVSKPGQAGGFRFRLITVKPRVFNVAMGGRVSGAIDVRGREDAHQFDPSGATQVRLTGLTPDCSTSILVNLFDVTEGRTVAGGRLLCGSNVTLTLTNPTHRHAIVVLSGTISTDDYSFTLERA